jgi:hypothetical protein
MKRKIIFIFMLITLLGTACSQTQEITTTPLPTSTILPTKTPTPTITPTPTETPLPTPTYTPDPNLLETSTALHLGPGMTMRFATKSTTPEDDAIIAMIRDEEIFMIEGLYFDRIGGLKSPVDAPVNAPAYVRVNHETNEPHVVAWYDKSSDHVIEASTGYPMNIRSNPGVGIAAGPNGEEYYVYGFAWYPPWERILPEPMIELVEAFYSEGIEYVQNRLEKFQTVADPDYFGGDLNLASWDEGMISFMEDWGAELAGAPFMALPDSGSVDIRDVHFQKVLNDGLIIVDESSVDEYILSDYPQNSKYDTNQSKHTVTTKLLTPFRTLKRYSDLHKLIILGGVDDHRGPLLIKIDFDLQGGFFVPDSGDKIIHIAPDEVNLMFGYDGIYFAKLPHELAHYIAYRDHDFIDSRCWPNEDDMVETFPYMLEYMWWVQQYPHNAPYWDWEPINSGLVLARLLNGSFPNFSCDD